MIRKAYALLFPAEEFNYTARLRYSKAFKGFNANIKKRNDNLIVSLSHEWKGVSEDIQIGLVQTLLLKILKKKGTTMQIEMYNSYLKNLSKYAEVSESDDALLESFQRVNEQYFNGMMDTPNLIWGSKSFSRLGTFDYGTNTIKMSKVLEKDDDLLDYVMYHEMLHKKLKFNHKDGRSYHHTREFRALERKWHDLDAEKKLQKLLSRRRLFSLFKG